MKINWYGKGGFLINGSKAKILLDPPFSSEKELRDTGADAVLASSDAVEYKHPIVLDWPGEYETKGVGIISIAFKDKDDKEINTFVLELDGIRLCHIGAMNRALTGDEVSLLGDVDVLFLPIGGGDVLDVKAAHKVADEIDARMVLPMYCEEKDIEDFRKEMGLKEDIEILDDIDVKGLSDEQTRFVFLNKTV